MARYIFITGGVVSSLGKGLASAALGALLQAPKQPPKVRAALTEILQLLDEAADTAEEAKL